jgi:acyl-[acyl-carrier-protein]-phospholipid O-acyltransferase / long-chain-fatty-acid--[acyl-carrier-protein] ligase
MTGSTDLESHPNSHPLRGLLIAQFCGAFNDNAWKLMVALFDNR